MNNTGTVYIGRINPQNERHQQDRVFDINGCSPTISAGEILGRYLIKEDINMKTIVGSKQANAFRGSIDGVSPTLTEAMGKGGGQIPLLTNATIQETKTQNFMAQERLQLPKELDGKKFRIRKLTPRECFRLMGVDDSDIDKIQTARISNSAQYKLAGNSIVVDVLFHIFRKMFVETENESQQLTLF